MDDYQRDYYLQWIIADFTPFIFGDKSFYISTAARESRFIAEQQYNKVYKEAIDNGLLDNNQLLLLLNKYDLWDAQREEILTALVKDIEEIKLKIFENYTSSTNRMKFKKALRDTENYISNMILEKQTFDQYGARSVAMWAKQHFLMGSSIYIKKNKPFLNGQWWDNKPDEVIQYAYKIMSEYLFGDSTYRELARCNQWRNIWAAKRSGSLFGKAMVDLSIHQRQLILWSNMYDNIYKNSACPCDSIIEDDDALDGWMIQQRRLRDKVTNKNIIEESLRNEKIRNSEHIYVMCDPQDIEKVYECNDLEGKIRLNSILKQTEKEGCVHLINLKDTRLEINRRAAELRGMK